MTRWIKNNYFLLKSTNDKCVQIATNLLNSYSLTRGCLKTLGSGLKDKLEFGFFEQGTDIITQDESGRDIFLLCSGKIDVLVSGQVVVQMDSPSLVGDKGIVNVDSKRAATIRISEGEQALVIKIPMGTFIRDFKDPSIEDEGFSQEKAIFENVFQNVQERLFEFMYLQKSLWEQVNNSIQTINQQFLAKKIDNRIDPGWDKESWVTVKNFLRSNFSIPWPDGVELNVANLNAALRKYLDLKFPDITKPGASAKKMMEWRHILFSVSGRVLKGIPDKMKPVPPLDLELFNPNIYRMRLMGLQKQLEKRYSDRQIRSETIRKLPTTEFFGSGDRTNEFNLSKYLDYFQKLYRLKNTKRLLAQVGQKCALISAECENNFNASVVKMQKFLEQVKAKNIAVEEVKTNFKIDPIRLKSWVSAVSRGVVHFRNSSSMIDGQTLGIIKFSEATYPNMTNLLKSHRAKVTRDQMNKAFALLIAGFRFQAEYVTKNMLYSIFHLCHIERGDTVPQSQIVNHYWFPISTDIKLDYQGQKLVDLRPGLPIGGETWKSCIEERGEGNEATFSLTTVEDSLFLVLPKSKIPWIAQKEPSADSMIEYHLPLMQWMIDLYLRQILYFQQLRDKIVDEWMDIKEGIARSQKISEFERKSLKLPEADRNRIVSWLNNNFGMRLEADDSTSSSVISKKIYNFFLHSATKENPELSIEQKGNQAYTRWRNLLFEIVDQIPALNRVVSDVPGRTSRPVLNILVKQLSPILSHRMKETWEKRNPITSGTPKLNILSILHPDKHESCQQAIDIFESIHQIFSKNVFHLLIEITQHQATLKELHELQSKTDTGVMQSTEQIDIMEESIQHLIKMLKEMEGDTPS